MEKVPLLVALVGLVVAGARAFQVGKMGINADAFTAVVEKLLRARDLTRCRKLFAAIGDAPLAAGMNAMIAERQFPHDVTEDDAGATLRDAFIRGFEEKARPIATSRFAAWLSLALLVAPAAHGFLTGALTVPVVVVSLFGLAVLGWTMRAAAKLFDSGRIVLDRVLPHTLPIFVASVSTYRAPEVSEPEPPKATSSSVVVRIERNGANHGTECFEQPIIKIGRMNTAHLRLDDAGVSRMHAVIERDAEGVSIIDLGSDAGTLVNGSKVNKAKLAHGDVVGIGPYRLTMGIGEAPSATAPIETDDPRTWDQRVAVLYGFDQRSSDLFFDVVGSCISGGARIAKVRRKEGTPRFVVLVLAADVDALSALRTRIEEQAPGLYRSYATPAAEIAPDAVYGAETSTHGKILAEVLAGQTEVLATRTVA